MRLISTSFFFFGFNLFGGFLLLESCDDGCGNLRIPEISFSGLNTSSFLLNDQTGQEIPLEQEDSVKWNKLFIEAFFDYNIIAKNRLNPSQGTAFACSPVPPHDVIIELKVFTIEPFDSIHPEDSDITSLLLISSGRTRTGSDIGQFFNEKLVYSDSQFYFILGAKPEFPMLRTLLFRAITDSNDTLTAQQRLIIY